MIFLTGGSGFLGQAILRELEKINIPVRATFRTSLAGDFKNVEWVKCDLLGQGLPSELLKGCSCVIHSAGSIKGDKKQLERSNCEATKKLLQLALDDGVRKFIFISSIDAVLSDTAYAQSKKMAEEAVTVSGLDWVIVRPSVIFGQGDDKNFALLDKMVKKLPIIPVPYSGKFKWEPVFVNDLAEYILALSEDANVSRKVFNVVGPQELAFNQILDVLQKYNRVKRIILPIPDFIVNGFKKTFTFFFSQDKVDAVFSPFCDKLVNKNDNAEKIRLGTRVSEFFRGDRNRDGAEA